MTTTLHVHVVSLYLIDSDLTTHQLSSDTDLNVVKSEWCTVRDTHSENSGGM